MLNEKQLKDAAKCREMNCVKDCSMCTDKNGTCGECTEAAAKTALVYRYMLGKHVWHKRSSDGEYFCIECRNNKKIGHERGCELAALLKEGEKE